MNPINSEPGRAGPLAPPPNWRGSSGDYMGLMRGQASNLQWHQQVIFIALLYRNPIARPLLFVGPYAAEAERIVIAYKKMEQKREQKRGRET